MRYIPHSSETEKIMISEIGLSEFEELLDIIPSNIRIKDKLGLSESLSEFDLEKEFNDISNSINSKINPICFKGAGAYDHFVPSVVDFLANRSEFYTSYTPYQAEVSQGTLQYLYEFQTMICEITGMDIANASLYDGGSAIAEACSVALAYSRKKKIYISEGVNPKYIEVIKTYLSYRDSEIILVPLENGYTKLINIDWDNSAGIVVQCPNYFGLIEDIQKIKEQFPGNKTQLIITGDPFNYGILKSPGECGADIYAGEGQVFGNYLSYGGPYLGLFAVKKHLIRKIPGRIIGKTEDIDGKTGFVLTLQTREQHIRRENATSNICTNQGLLALRATIYLSLIGKEGFQKLAQQCFSKAHYLANKLNELKNYSIDSTNFIREFLLNTNYSAYKIVEKAYESGFSLKAISDNQILLAVTEKRTDKEINNLIAFLENFNIEK
jgi:glycine dehydrogenase subunit 1